MTTRHDLADLDGYDFAQARALSVSVHWLADKPGMDDPTEHHVAIEGDSPDVLGSRLHWLARKLDPMIDRIDREHSERLDKAEHATRSLGRELESARQQREASEAKWERAMIRGEGLALALDLLARRVLDSEHEHDETIADLRRAEEDLDDARTKIVTLKTRIGELLAAEATPAPDVDEEPF
jgi:chromosome segregation ATPase